MSTAMNLKSVKAELKAWEHAFLAKHGHTATLEDIKADPIAEKYKLYKKLQKEAHSNEQKNDIPQKMKQTEPRTPSPSRASSSKHHTTTAAVIPKSRPITSSVSTTTVNPFSPVKNKQSNGSSTTMSLNPFITPVKAKQRKRTPSPDFFITSPKNPSVMPPPEKKPEISKARKRLRGESVSPSPQPRDKRPRAGSLSTTAAKMASACVTTPEPVTEEGDSFVDDSPVKAPVPGKAFTPLFEETLPLSQPVSSKAGDTVRGRSFVRSQTMPSGLFGMARKDGEKVRKGGGGHVPLSNGKQGKDCEKLPNERKKSKRKVLPGPKGLIPGKDDLFADAATHVPTQSSSRKRNLSKVTDDEKEHVNTSNTWHLLPPSPPPQHSDTKRYNSNGHVKTLKKRKKAERSFDIGKDAEADDTTSLDEVEVKIVALHARAGSPSRHEDELALDIDPELQRQLRNRTADRPERSVSPALSRFEVDLPEEMQRMLALTPPKGGDREKEEEHAVKSLIRGRRRALAEVWGPGEFEGESEGGDDLAAVDDWESEGVPWEVAEL